MLVNQAEVINHTIHECRLQIYCAATWMIRTEEWKEGRMKGRVEEWMTARIALRPGGASSATDQDMLQQADVVSCCQKYAVSSGQSQPVDRCSFA